MIYKNVFGKLGALGKLCHWWFYNYKCSRQFKKISIEDTLDGEISFPSIIDMFYLNKAYKKSFGCKLSIRLIIVTLLLRKKTCFLLKSNKKIIASNLFYFHQKEFQCGYIHSGFMFVDSDFQGNNVGTRFKQNILCYLQKCDNLKGVCTRVNKDNISSFSIQKKMGFEIVCDDNEQYYMQLTF